MLSKALVRELHSQIECLIGSFVCPKDLLGPYYMSVTRLIARPKGVNEIDSLTSWKLSTKTERQILNNNYKIKDVIKWQVHMLSGCT